MVFDESGNWLPGKSALARREQRWNTPGQAPASQAPQGLAANIANLKDRASGRNYVNFDGNMTGGLGNFATYNGVGISEDAYKSMVQPNGVTDAAEVEGLTVNTPSTGGTDWMGGLGAASKGLSAIGGLANAYMAKKSLDLARDQFNAEKNMANANYVNSAKAYNEQLGRKANVGMALGGNTIDPARRAAILSGVEAQKVSEKPVVI